jgi:hypothetical protein
MTPQKDTTVSTVQQTVYTPPKAMRMGDLNSGLGGACATGSGDSNCNTLGNSATTQCSTGNSGAESMADPGCSPMGTGNIAWCTTGSAD